MILLSHGRSELVHDAAVETAIVVLRFLPKQRYLLIAYVEAKHISKHDACQHLERRGRRKPRSCRNVSSYDDVKSAVHLKAVLVESPHNTLWIRSPAFVFQRPEFIDAGLYNIAFAEVHGIETQFVIIPLRCRGICTVRQGTRKHMASVVISMLAYKVDPSRRKVRADIFCLSVYLPECLYYSVFHLRLISFPSLSITRSSQPAFSLS